MRRHPSTRLEALETRMLLTRSQVAAAHPAPAVVDTPIAIDGTLAVDMKDSVQMEDADASWTTTVPVSGKLGALGEVHGTWETTIDAYGGYLGPDTLQLQTKTPKGSFTVDFNNENPSKPRKVTPEVGFYQHGQHLEGGKGAYARTSETGSIELMVDAKNGSVASLVLITANP